ncbi:MAG: DNA polymerase III subunit gamma/tau [Clostridia bacterium]|jgi:DNA polymerase-3 subunit gamma/tau
MSYIALYRKWRPLVFEDVVEQQHVVKTLRQSVTTGRIANTYLFCGTRGTGKTSMAKIFSRAINCLSPNNGDPCNECEICKGLLNESILDVIEIDAASNNSVDNVRQIRDEVIYAPSKAKWKVYIIDEVHMLSTGAFNALLKTLEEPPSHTVFILATTDPQKLPATILSRCQRFDFRRISIESISERLNAIAKDCNVNVSEDALLLIARLADGALRDAISILDQCISIGNIDIGYEDVINLVGIVNDSFMFDLAGFIKAKDINKILTSIDDLIQAGKDVPHFVSDLILYYRNLLICKLSGNVSDIIQTSADVLVNMKELAATLSNDEIYNIITELSLLHDNLKWVTLPRTALEVALIKLCENTVSLNSDDVNGRLNVLEDRMSKLGNAAGTMPAEAKTAPKPEPQTTSHGNSLPENSSQEAVAENLPQESITENHPQEPSPRTVPEQKVEANPIEEDNSVPEPAQKSETKTDKDEKELSCWSEISDEIKSFGRMAIYSNLYNSKAYELSDKIIGISFKGNSHINEKIIFSADNKKYIEEIISKKLGKEILIKCIKKEEFIPENINETEETDFLDKATEAAKKLNIKINIIDE